MTFLARPQGDDSGEPTVVRSTPSAQRLEAASKDSAGWTWLISKLRRRTADGRYRPEIDGLRFIAVSLVVLGHLMERCMRSLPGSQAGDFWYSLSSAKAWAGVLLFFTISGFIITNQFLKSKFKIGSSHFIKSYFQRRIFRIEPPYFILLIITYLFIRIAKYSPPVSQRFWQVPHSMELSLIASLFYLHGLIFNTFPRLFPPGWSLEIEVQFYIIAPVIFFAYFTLLSKRMRATVGGALLVAFVALSAWLPPSSHAPFLRQSLLVDLPEFWLGVLLADFQADLRNALDRQEWLAGLLGWSGAVLFIGWDSLWRVSGPFGSVSAQAALLAGIFMMFCGVLGRRGGFRGFCSLAPISVIGGACYSVYLTHLQVMQVLTPITVHLLHLTSFAAAYPVTLLIEAPVVLAVAMIFYVTVEKPFMAADWPARAWARLRALRA